MSISEQSIKKICSAAIYKRGLEYFNQGRVHIKNRTDNSVMAVVDGEDIYNVSIKFSDDGEVKDYFCTCPYYETMETACKHIVAVAEERRSECDENFSKKDENDHISDILLNEFCRSIKEKKFLPVSFDITFRKSENLKLNYNIAIKIFNKKIDSPEELLECYINKRPFSINKKLEYHPDEYTFGEYEEKIFDILAESYQSRVARYEYYSKSIGDVPVGGEAIKRIIPILKYVSYDITINSMNLGRCSVYNENPDILIDISAVLDEISLFVANYGICLVPDASAFYYDGAIYTPSSSWSRTFLPIYRALATDCRTQISFKGKNALSFATNVLPVLKDMQGVVTDGINEYVISEKPVFTVYVDNNSGNVRCKLKTAYGAYSFFFPERNFSDRYIVVRDTEKEAEFLEYFDGFSEQHGYYTATDNEVIYDFLTKTLPVLKLKYNVVETDGFGGIKIKKDIELSAHISYNSSIKLLDAKPDSELSPKEIMEILSAVKLKNEYYRSKNGDFFDIQSISDKVLKFDRLFGITDNFEKREIPEYNLLYLSVMAEKNGGINITAEEDLINYIEKIRSVKGKIPTHLKAIMRDYQKVGVDWMTQLSNMGLGGILADDMGLGKTVQMLAYLYALEPTKPVLIVTPSALTYNWVHECDKFIPDAKTVVIDGAVEERLNKINSIKNYEFVIVSYPILRRDIEEFEKIEFSYCILDEAQAIKNPKTISANSVKKIKADRHFALTGTPIENSLKELWSIFDFIMPGYLADYNTFHEVYEAPIVRDNNANVMNELREKIKPFILRRMKKDVLSELPDKIEDVIYAKMTDEQEKMYIAYREVAKNKALSILQGDKKSNIEILTLLLRLRQISCHPSLFDSAYTAESGKLNLLLSLLDTAISSGHRILIFSQFTSMLSMIAGELKKRELSYFYIDGSTPPQKRLEFADRFNDGENDIFLISLKAGGTGLNLIGADTVIHYDPWWNPAVTDQASDRAYRIGQDKNVHIIRLACENSIEAKIIELQEAKRSLANDIININSQSLGLLTSDEILSLFD